jgi:predicted nucleotidyltransferase
VQLALDNLVKAQMAAIFEGHSVVFAYLFGSQARGETGLLSDVDIAIYLSEAVAREQRFDLRLTVLGELSDLLKTDAVDVVVLNDAPPLLTHRILKEGLLLFCADERVRLEFETHAVLKYLDWKPYLKKYTCQVFGGAQHDG